MAKRKSSSAASGPTAPATVRDHLLSVLRGWEPAAGETGFEGLVAQALAAFTGYTFRLARSGAQFGRDAATPNAPFAIAMEAKRYKEAVPLQELVGKATLAAFALAEGVDVWVLAATVEVSEPTERSLERILDESGISLLTLDWPETGLPPLAVLLAATRADVLAWAKPLRSPPQYAQLVAGLDDIAADAAYEGHLAKLTERLSSGLLGLDALRAKSGAWCDETFADRKRAQRRFSQFLTPLEASAPTIDRPRINQALDAAVKAARTDADGDTLVAVLGQEGAGKTWAVAKWWLDQAPRPILLLSVGRISEHLSAGDDALDMLARLAAHQHGRVGPETVARWRRRLARWSQGGDTQDRFLVLVDGLNETSGKAWSTILRDLLLSVHALGGVLIATCRQAYWDREIVPRIGLVTVNSLKVGDYDDTEFSDIMARNGVDLATLPERLNRFMRNPRICALAITLRDRLQTIQDLTVDRLLLEYWRARLFERGDLVGHDDLDFKNLLVRHAGDYRARPGTDFSRDEWRSRSGAAARGDGRALANDLSDIEEGRFFDVSSGAYSFRPETLHFALGLLVADEVREVFAKQPADLEKALNDAIDPVGGFDDVADILAAAIATACLDSQYPDPGIIALVSAWMVLQNVSDEAFEGLFPYIALRPEPFLDAYEAGIGADDGRFTRFIHAAADRSAVATVIDKRINRWLGTWSRALPDYTGGVDRARRAEQRLAGIEERLDQLTQDERAYFDTRCHELPKDTLLSSSAALYLWRRDQAQFAQGLVAYAFAHVIAGHPYSPHEDLSWVVRLNRTDHVALAKAVNEELAPFLSDQASLIARLAAASALRLLATVASVAQAQALNPPADESRDVDDGEADPLDPTGAGGDVAAVTTKLRAVDPAAYWKAMSPSPEDDDLKRRFEELARFDLSGLRSILDAIAGTVGQRTGLPLRQLGWRLPWLSPVLGDATVAAISSRIAALGLDPSLAPSDDAEFVTGMMVEAVLPWLEADAQFDLIVSLPAKAPFYARYGPLLKPLDEAGAAHRLASVLDDDPDRIVRALLVLAESGAPISDMLRDQVGARLRGAHAGVRAAAAVYVGSCEDLELDELLVTLPIPDADDQGWIANASRSALASAIVRLGRDDLVTAIPIEHLDWVAARLPAAQPPLADAIEMMIDRLTQPVVAVEPGGVAIVLEVGGYVGDARYRLVDQSTRGQDAFAALKEELDDTNGARFARRQRLMHDQFDQFLSELAGEGAQAVARRPYTVLLDALARTEPDRYRRWLDALLALQDEQALRRLQNLGLALARNFAVIDPDLAARTFEHLWPVEPNITVLCGYAKHALRDLALFGVPSSPGIDQLRARAFVEALDDQRIERLVLAAESVGAGPWLEAFLAERVASPFPADQALALTAASFRATNAQSDELLGRAWGDGFLGEAARSARIRYHRLQRAEHWLAQASKAQDRAECWRDFQLVTACVDKRLLLNPTRLIDGKIAQMGGEILTRIVDASEKLSGEGLGTLLGARRPNNLIREMAK